MSTLKLVLKSHCGEPSAVATLASNYGNNPSEVNSGAGEGFLELVPRLSQHSVNSTSGKQSSYVPTFDIAAITQELNFEHEAQGGSVQCNHATTPLLEPHKSSKVVRTRGSHQQQLAAWRTHANTTFPLIAHPQQNTFNQYYRTAREQLDANSHGSISAIEFLNEFDNKTANDLADEEWIEEFLSRLKEYSTISSYDTSYDDELAGNGYFEYNFNENNPYSQNSDPIQEGNTMFSQGMIRDAILCCEAELRKNPENAEAWCLLGFCYARNEHDSMAIAAFENSLKINPKNCKALLGLSVSLTNESHDSYAIKMLGRWLGIFLEIELKMPSMVLNHSISSINEIELKFLEVIEKIKSLFGDLSPGMVAVQDALSVLYSLMGNYEKAIECIKIALSIDPENPELWNRLGAVLANIGSSIEAIEAYKKALEKVPAYPRVFYNLGISYMNTNNYREAAYNFLRVLNLLETSEETQQQIDHIWTKLRSVLVRSEIQQTEELVDALNNKNTKILLELLAI